MNKSCQQCLRGPAPNQANTYCRQCGDDLTFYVAASIEQAEESGIDVSGQVGNEGLHYGTGSVLEISLYPVKIEAIDQDGDLLFSVKTIDAEAAILDIKTALTVRNIKPILIAIETAVAGLRMGV